MAGPSVSYSNLTDRQTLSVTGGFTHFYINIKAQDSNPTFLLLHGFPISVYDWRKQITSLSAAGYGIPAPDLLGYGETDHPDDVEEYTQSKMAVHVAEILEKEGLSQVIGAGHDWYVNDLSMNISSIRD
jgi:soluble epoxide hydrolase/lipid-phosphate phosphatase